MIKFTHVGDFQKTFTFFKKRNRERILKALNKYAQKGVNELRKVTPIDTQMTRNSWSYRIEEKDNTYSITFLNDSIAGDTSVVILLQYGHGTRNGRYVQGRDFINPAIQPIFDDITAEVWKEVMK